MSAGTANPATWPMWRGALAYGHAGATRIFCGDGDADTGGHDTSRSERHRPRGADEGCEEPPAREWDRRARHRDSDERLTRLARDDPPGRRGRNARLDPSAPRRPSVEHARRDGARAPASGGQRAPGIAGDLRRETQLDRATRSVGGSVR